jgi:hypothetical protein
VLKLDPVSGKMTRTMKWYDHDAQRLVAGAPMVIFTAYPGMYKNMKKAKHLMVGNFINLRQMGRAFNVSEVYYGQALTPRQLAGFKDIEGATSGFLFILKADPRIVRLVSFKGLAPTTWEMNVTREGDVLEQDFITSRSFSIHPITAYLKGECERYNSKADPRFIIGEDGLRDKFELAAYISLGYSFIVNVRRDTIPAVMVDGKITVAQHDESDAELYDKVMVGSADRWASKRHIEDGWQRESGKSAGLTFEDYRAADAE